MRLNNRAHRLAAITLLTIAALAIATGTSAAKTPKAAKVKTAPQISALNIASAAHLAAAGTRVTVSGQISCTTAAKYHIILWLVGPTPGAFTKATLPPKAAKTVSPRPIANICTGNAQPWTIIAAISGKTPSVFSAGPIQACVMATTSKGRLYATIKQMCSTLAAS